MLLPGGRVAAAHLYVAAETPQDDGCRGCRVPGRSGPFVLGAALRHRSPALPAVSPAARGSPRCPVPPPPPLPALY